MKAYINAISAISAQQTFEQQGYLNDERIPEEDYYKAIEPSYRDYLDPKMARRMARIIKMGVATSKKCLYALPENTMPGAIIVGTGLGCLQDTSRFLKDIIETEEGLLSPTAFIQSTHNTIAGQIALLIGCPNHNFTYANRGFSFENALGDALVQLEEGNDHVLVGALDEVIPETNSILKEIGCFESPNEGKNLPALGEGATMFMMSANKGSDALASVNGLSTLYKPKSVEQVQLEASKLLQNAGITINDLDGVVLGYNNSVTDKWYNDFHSSYAQNVPVYQFKNLCGEYFTASAFGTQLAVQMIAQQKAFLNTQVQGVSVSKFDHLLVYNHFNADYHSLVLLSRC